MHTGFLSEDLKGGDQSEDRDVDGKIILEWILGGIRKDWLWIVAGSCEHGREFD
jgi:hypothetical protein